MTIEEHPLEPFLPENARVLFLGSFPPPKARWSMEFFYPNWINDFWRVQGLIHFGDAHYFEASSCLAGDVNPVQNSANPVQNSANPVQNSANPVQNSENVALKRFDKARIVAFCQAEGMAFYDTACKVCRLRDNADDNFLQVEEQTDVSALLRRLPLCRNVVTTGGKASEELQAYLAGRGVSVAIPKVGKCVRLVANLEVNTEECVPADNISEKSVSGELMWWRMPSTSRAYPMKLELKAQYYEKLTHFLQQSQ